VSVFRPAARVTAPDGCTWELYAYKLKLPDRGKTYDPGLAPDDPVGLTLYNATVAEGEALLGLFDGVLWVLGLIPRLLVRVLWDVPRAGLRARHSDEWTIEAVAWLPHETRYTWTTTGEFRRNVLAQLEGQLARGEQPPRLTRATYIGATG
jgi:hypothetical protein